MKDGLHNLLEPHGVIAAFMDEPPEGFVPVLLRAGDKEVPGFKAELDIFTTADDKIRNIYLRCRKYMPSFVRKLFKPMALFIGTTVSEYSLFPGGLDLLKFRDAAIAVQQAEKLPFLIIKDIPVGSPLLSDEENYPAAELFSNLADSGFLMLYGQALAYVPVSFASTDEYLMRLSRTRRKDIKRKLRALSEIEISEVGTGDAFFSDKTIEELYGLYLNVYEKSYVHFDRLTISFFRRVFRDPDVGGIVFLYRHQGEVIGFNLCFEARQYLVDKYVGFRYPKSQEFNLYFVSWFHNIEYCLRRGLKAFVAGWTDPEIKAYLGADFTHTFHAVYIANPILRLVLGCFRSMFEADKHTLEKIRTSLCA